MARAAARSAAARPSARSACRRGADERRPSTGPRTSRGGVDRADRRVDGAAASPLSTARPPNGGRPSASRPAASSRRSATGSPRSAARRTGVVGHPRLHEEVPVRAPAPSRRAARTSSQRRLLRGRGTGARGAPGRSRGTRRAAPSVGRGAAPPRCRRPPGRRRRRRSRPRRRSTATWGSSAARSSRTRRTPGRSPLSARVVAVRGRRRRSTPRPRAQSRPPSVSATAAPHPRTGRARRTPAHEQPGPTSPVEQAHRALTGSTGLVQCVAEPPAEQPEAGRLLAGVDHLEIGQPARRSRGGRGGVPERDHGLEASGPGRRGSRRRRRAGARSTATSRAFQVGARSSCRASSPSSSTTIAARSGTGAQTATRPPTTTQRPARAPPTPRCGPRRPRSPQLETPAPVAPRRLAQRATGLCRPRSRASIPGGEQRATGSPRRPGGRPGQQPPRVGSAPGPSTIGSEATSARHVAGPPDVGRRRGAQERARPGRPSATRPIRTAR